MSAMEDNDKNDISVIQCQNNENLIADSQGESKRANENVEGSEMKENKPKGKASEVYANRNTNKRNSNKTRFTGISEARNLQFRPPRDIV